MLTYLWNSFFTKQLTTFPDLTFLTQLYNVTSIKVKDIKYIHNPVI